MPYYYVAVRLRMPPTTAKRAEHTVWEAVATALHDPPAARADFSKELRKIKPSAESSTGLARLAIELDAGWLRQLADLLELPDKQLKRWHAKASRSLLDPWPDDGIEPHLLRKETDVGAALGIVDELRRRFDAGPFPDRFEVVAELKAVPEHDRAIDALWKAFDEPKPSGALVPIMQAARQAIEHSRMAGESIERHRRSGALGSVTAPAVHEPLESIVRRVLSESRAIASPPAPDLDKPDWSRWMRKKEIAKALGHSVRTLGKLAEQGLYELEAHKGEAWSKKWRVNKAKLTTADRAAVERAENDPQ